MLLTVLITEIREFGDNWTQWGRKNDQSAPLSNYINEAQRKDTSTLPDERWRSWVKRGGIFVCHTIHVHKTSHNKTRNYTKYTDKLTYRSALTTTPICSCERNATNIENHDQDVQEDMIRINSKCGKHTDAERMRECWNQLCWTSLSIHSRKK